MPKIFDIDKLASLKKGWNGYQGEPTTKEAINKVKGIQIVPMPCGGLYLCIDGEVVMIAIAADGSIFDINVDVHEIAKLNVRDET